MDVLRYLLRATRKQVPALLLGLGVFLFLDWVVIDLWQVRGQVVDSATGQGIDGAWLLANFYGEEPLIVFPISVHPPSRTATCMGSRVLKTGPSGHFSFASLSFNRALARKHASIFAFGPGWIATRVGSPVSSSVLGWPQSVQIEMDKVGHERRDSRSFHAAAKRLSAHERTYSIDLLRTLSLLSEHPCGRQSSIFMINAMNYTIEIAETYAERERARGWCRHMKQKATNSTAPERRDLNLNYDWPFDCENLPFKKQPSAETLAVEAEIAAQRRK